MAAITNYTIGDEITYTIPDASPERRERLWHGKITYIWTSTRCLKVELLDAGYEGLPELVRLEQVVPPDMRLCEFCKQYHPINDEGFVCPLKPK